MKAYQLLIPSFLFFAAPAEASTCGGLNPILVSSTALSFGNYSPASASSDNANATITVACTVQLNNSLPSFSIAISAGNSGSFTARQMSLLTAILKYNIYTSSAYTTIWGDGTGSTSIQSYSASTGAASQTFTAYGSIPNNQYVTAGIYGDTLTISVIY